MRKKMLIEGMSCGHCIAHVAEALEDIGANDIVVSLEEKSATCEIKDSVTDEEIKAAIEEAGYDVVKFEEA